MGLGISSSGVACEFFGFAVDDPVALKNKEDETYMFDDLAMPGHQVRICLRLKSTNQFGFNSCSAYLLQPG